MSFELGKIAKLVMLLMLRVVAVILCPSDRITRKDNEANVFDTMSTGFPSAAKYILTSSSRPRLWMSITTSKMDTSCPLTGGLPQISCWNFVSGLNNSLITMILKSAMLDTAVLFNEA